tara:strand:- start:3667 stop:3819 length:153 start_codon:yes stop_codon:yes gene_type:complete
MDTGARVRAIYARIVDGKRVKQSTLDKYGITYEVFLELLALREAKNLSTI